MTRLLLRISAATRRWAIARLRRRKMKDIASANLSALRNHRAGIGLQSRQMHTIVTATLNTTGVSPGIEGIYLSGLQNDLEGVVIFDLVDGSQCYYIDPPGVCCCGSC